MPKAMFEELGYSAISPTMMTVQLAGSSIKYPEGHSRKSFGECERLICLCGICGPRHTRRNAIYSWVTIPKRCQCKD
jgi:hypothetical protein